MRSINWLTLTGLLLVTRFAMAATLTPIGFLGNSGGAGARLMRVETNGFARGTAGLSGVAVDHDVTLWAGAGTAINHVSLNGALIESVPLLPAGSVVESESFALLDGHLYFFGKLPDKRRALFGMAVRPRTKAALPPVSPVVTNLPTMGWPWESYRLAAQPLDGRLLMAVNEAVTNDSLRVVVYAWKPGTPEFVRLCTVAGDGPRGIAVDPDQRRIYIGGLLAPRPGSPTMNRFWGITVINEKGEVADAVYPVARGLVSYSPVQYGAHINLAGGALWDLSRAGYLARLTLEGNADPGTVEQWQQELGYMAQIVDMGDTGGKPSGVLACAADRYSAVYVGHWQPATRKMEWVRRIGCLPVITSLWLTPEGWVSVGTGNCQAWWRFDDAGDAPPHKGELFYAVTPAVQRGNQCMALGGILESMDNPQKNCPTPLAFSWEASPQNAAVRLADATPLKAPVGLTVENPAGDGMGWLFVSDADTRKIWRTKVFRPNMSPDNIQWKPLAYVDPATEKQLEIATDLAWLPDNTLLVAVESALVLLKPADTVYAVAWRFDRWGDAPEARFGARLRFSLSGNRMLVADTDRHRVLLFDLASRTLLAQAGVTDKPGDGSSSLNSPTLVSLVNDRAVVADSGNQRVMRLVIMPCP